ncbi:MAG: hypothetical protein AUJ49_05115 [Desulfovibrionaceae bacterium CG1_02_65_16]|nr:MAG: hypothetical protein AUJ49_05115 [Desulfovibrionaceae bacterium CG1_02_65_16]
MCAQMAEADGILFSLRFPEGCYEFISPSVEALFGFSPRDFYANAATALRCVAPDWREQMRARMEDMARGDVAAEYSFQIIDRHGQLRWMRQRQILLSMAGGWRVVGVAQWLPAPPPDDPQPLPESRRRALDEGWSEQVVLRLNLQSRVMEYVSPGIERITGRPAADFYANPTPFLEVISPEWRGIISRWAQELAQGFLRPEYEYAVQHTSGQQRWVNQRGTIIRNAEGRPAVAQFVLFDVTERRGLEDALRESDQRLRLLSENLVDVIWAMDENLRWTYMSHSAEALLGLPVERLMARSLPEMFSHESLAGIDQALAHWRGQDKPEADAEPSWLGLELFDANGGLVPVEVLARPTFNAQGRISGYCGTARDARLNRHMERVETLLSRLAKSLLECEDLAQSQALASACAEAVTGARRVVAAHRDPDTGLLRTPEGPPPCAEPGALSLAVLHAGEEVGRLIAWGVPPEHAAEARQLLERVASLFALAVTRLRAEDSLRKNERMARKLLESMHEGVWAMDRDQRGIFANERLAAMLGYSVPELLALSPTDVLAPQHLQQALERMREHRLGLAASADCELRRKNGTLLPVRLNSSPILDESGGFEGLVCTAEDLSEHRLMERELRNNQARFEALYELSRFASSTEEQTAEFTLREALRLTGSTAGMLFFVTAPGDRLTFMASVGGANHHGADDAPPSFRVDDGSPWAQVCARAAPLIMNDARSLAGRLPPGHPLVERFLGAPALDDDRTAAVLGLTGKPCDYTPDDGLHVSLLLDGMWRIVRGRRDQVRIQASLREKEALLREVHHRVKNNLQVVSSLLDMAGRRLPDPDARRSMEEVRAKVLAISLVHAQLHGEGAAQAETGQGVDLERYVRALFRQLREIYSGNMELSVSVLLDGLALGLDQAAPLGLALNEILANAFKHGRKEGEAGRVRLRAWRDEDGDVRIEVRDQGPGLPPGFSPEHANSLGLKLMFGLVCTQLGGKLSLTSQPGGVCAHIRFRPNIAE